MVCSPCGYNDYMKHIRSQFAKLSPKDASDNKTERGEFMRYFCDRLNVSRKKDGLSPISMPRMGRILEGVPTKDLYYLQSVCDKAENFSKKFWWELRRDSTNEGK